MPLFNYKCLECGNIFEELVRTADEKVACPKCKSNKVEKKLPHRLNSSSSVPVSHKSSCG
ncbi:zinc ribbon domain-containing protein [Caloramator sp. E03]|uniref:FmdB family zinc ribbon protein n=1 Tax=Caloramator sp. E03 TaxID=2576307 RepID=UPI00111050BC|nr:zinc ribbon domain-containing protein [Caloramator sp. E03]QCX33257.1 zinc ribbon domain-containing protein [Caloramator sp. E03]